jgi:hypothetical protein
MTDKEKKPSVWTAQRVFMGAIRNGPPILTALGCAALALAAAVLDLKEMQLLQAIVAVMTLMGTMLLAERYIDQRAASSKIESLESKLDRVLAASLQGNMVGIDDLIKTRKDLAALEERLTGALSVSILAGSAFRLMNEYQGFFESLVASGCSIRFLVTDPNSSAVEHLSASVVYESSDIEKYKRQLTSALDSLSALAKRNKKQVSVRVTTVSLPFSIVQMSNRNGEENIQVEIYGYNIPARDRPVLSMKKAREPRTYELFKRQYESLWDAAKPMGK